MPLVQNLKFWGKESDWPSLSHPLRTDVVPSSINYGPESDHTIQLWLGGTPANHSKSKGLADRSKGC